MTIASNKPGLTMQNILFATDFLESSRLALDYAVAFAHHYGATLTILHVFELRSEAREIEMVTHRPSLSREHASARIEAFAAGVKRLGVRTAIDLRPGEPCAAILAAVAENKADLLVLGTHGIYRGVQHVLVGSNAEKILLSATCPTLTVGRHVMAGIDLNLSFSKILFLSDMSPESVRAALYATSLAQDFGIPIELVILEADHETAEAASSVASADRFCADLKAIPGFSNPEWCDPAYISQRTATLDEVTRRAMKCADILLVLGVHDMSRLQRHIHASFAFELIARSSCPVLSIRGDANGRG